MSLADEAPAAGVVRQWALLRRNVRDATRLGARFRVLGADVEIEGAERLPDQLRYTLAASTDDGMLRSYLGVDDVDNELDFLDGLGVETALVTDRAGAIASVKELTTGQHVAIDLETAHNGPRPAVNINADGSVSAIQDDGRKDDAGLDPHRAEIATLQAYSGGKRCFVFRGEALRLMLGSRWLREQHLVAHNAGFELAFLRKHATAPPSAKARFPVECTAQADGLIHGTERLIKGIGRRTRSLENAARDNLGVVPPKALQLSDWSAPRLSDGQLAYAAADAVLAWRLWPKLQSELRSKLRWGAYLLQRDALPAVADMKLRGLGIDLDEHSRQIEQWGRDLAEARRQYCELTGNPPPANDAEIREWIARTAPPEQLKTWKRTEETGELSVAEVCLKRLALLGDPTVKFVLAMRSTEKLIRNFGPKLASFVHPATGRIHCNYSVGATKAGRFAASFPNLQQLPNARAPDFRACIVAAPGNLLVGCDWNQVEMRAAAWLSKDRALNAVYAEGRDLHRETAAAIARVPPDRVTPEQRQAAKPVNYGAIYGIGPATLAENAFADYGIEMTEVEAQAALDRFFGNYQGFNDWRWEHWRRVKASGRVRVPGSGRVVEGGWEFEGRIRFTQACNIPIQGMAADALLRAIKLVHTRIRGIDGGPVACLHDELLLEVPEADADRARATLEESMIEAFAVTFPGAPLAGIAEAKIGRTWKDVK